jgi:hypothetical protein
MPACDLNTWRVKYGIRRETVKVIERQSTISIRSLAASEHHAVQEQHFYDCHIRSVQEQYDAPASNEFCQWILQHSSEDPVFTTAVLFVDKSYFNQTGIANIHNEHMWSGENPHAS